MKPIFSKGKNRLYLKAYSNTSWLQKDAVNFTGPLAGSISPFAKKENALNAARMAALEKCQQKCVLRHFKLRPASERS